jgi:hypothetical protein
MRRRKLLAAVGLAVLVATGVFALWPRENRITREGFVLRIHYGMTLAEVEAILGPPGDYRTIRTVRPSSYSSTNLTPAIRGQVAYTREHIFISEADFGKYLVWLCDEGDGFIWLRAGVVWSKGFVPGEKVAQSPLDDLLWRAERLWRKWFPE